MAFRSKIDPVTGLPPHRHSLKLPDNEKGSLLPPFTSVPGLGETAAWSIMEQREGKRFISIEEFSAACPKVSKTHIEQLKAAGALDGMPDTSQITLFDGLF